MSKRHESRKVEGHELPLIAEAFVKLAPRFVEAAETNTTYRAQGRTNLRELAACDLLARYEEINGGVDFNAANVLYAIALAATKSVKVN